MTAPTVSLSFFRDAFDNCPKQRTVPLARLVERLTSFRLFPDIEDKRQLPAWSPATFQAGARRSAAMAVAISCAVLDFDDGTSIDAAIDSWRDCFHLVYTSWSHRPEHPKFRLVVPLATPVRAAEWPAAWAQVWTRSGRCADASCKDVGRIYFLPALRGPDQPHDVRVHDGAKLLRLDPAPAVAPAPRARPALSAITVPQRDVQRAVRARLASSADLRERIAGAMGARLVGQPGRRRAEDLPCPACGHPSVWFYIEPGAWQGAACQHRNSCGWRGFLDELYLLGAP